MIEQLAHHPFAAINRNRKADALIAAAVGSNCRVDTDDFAIQIDQRTAGIARIDRRVGLNKVLVVIDANTGPPLGADYGRDRNTTRATLGRSLAVSAFPLYVPC